MSPTGSHAIDNGPGDCTVAVAFAGAQAVLAVRGELDLLTAPRLGTFFEGVIAAGHHSVVLDLAECAFLDASGLRVIANAADRLATSGGELAVRSPSAMIVRILGITRLDRVVRLELSQLTPDRRGPGQPTAASGKSCRRLAIQPLREVAASPAAYDMLDSAPQGEPVGALNLCSCPTDAFAPKAQALVAVFASESSPILAAAGVGVPEHQPTERQLSTAATGSPPTVTAVELADRVRG